jgi:hypothetical protein
MDIVINLKFFSFTRKITIGKQWVQFGIIAAVALISMLISFWGSTTMLILALALIGGMAVILALIKQPNLGFILIFLGGMFVPFSGPSGLNAATLVVALMLGLWILDMLAVQRQFTLIRSRAMLPVMIFLGISVLAFGMGQISWFVVFARQAPITAQAGGFAIFIFSIGALLLAAHQIKDIRWLEIIVWTFIGLGAFYVLGRAVRLPFMDRLYQYGFTTGSMFWTWLVALAFGQLMYNGKLRPRTKGLLVAVLLLTFYVAIVQAYDWKSGWVPPLVAVLSLLGIRFRKYVVFALPFVVVGAVYVAFDLIASDDYSWGTRVDAWRIILEISRVSPLLGMGFSNYYWYTPLFPIRGWRVSFNSHSQFVDLIAQVGYLGLFCFIWIFLALGRMSWDLSRRLKDGFARGYAYGVLAGIAGTLVAAFLVDWVLPFVYNIGLTGFRASVLPWIFMGGLIGIEQMVRQNTLK